MTLPGRDVHKVEGVLERLGYTSVAVHYWEWDALDVCITQLKAQGPSRTCNESKEEEEEEALQGKVV